MDCCSNFTRTEPTRYKRLIGLGKWFAPGAALLLIPKCPLCVMAYFAAFTGVGLSFSAAHNLRLTLIAVSVTAIAYLTIRSLLKGGSGSGGFRSLPVPHACKWCRKS